MDKQERYNDFVDKCMKKYGNRFCYDDAKFVNVKTPILIHDNELNTDFWRIPELHLRYNDLVWNERKENVKSFGYWNVYENCYNESLKYPNKYAFQRACFGAYNGAVRNGWLNKIWENRDISTQYHSYDEKIHCVYVYEIPEYKTCYIGRTLNIIYRDRQHRNGTLKHGVKRYDNLHKFCTEHNMEVPKPQVLESGLNAKESQIKEDKYLKQYTSNGWLAINKASTGENVGSLGATIKWTYERCKEESIGCKNKEALRRKCVGAYNASRKNGWLNDFFVQVKKPNGYWNVFENCQKEAIKYKGVKEFSLKGGGAYNSSRKNGWLNKLKFKTT